MVEFGNLHSDGRYEHLGTLSQDAMRACPFFIMVFSHYREDGSCRCDDPEEQKRMVEEWGYDQAELPPPRSS